MAAKKPFLTLAILAVLGVSGLLAAAPGPEVKAAAPLECRFGVNVAAWNSIDIENKSVSAYDLPTLGTGYYLDWGDLRSPTVPDFISYLNILSVKDENYPTVLATVTNHVRANLGAVWVIGNEPDDHTTQQDDITAEMYGERFYILATAIRAADSTARIAFGTIIMPTPLRIMYLQRAWDHLKVLAGSRDAASALVDIWSPHNFLLNEEAPSELNPTPWGPGIPLGMEAEAAGHQEILDYSQMNDSALFKTRMLRFRQFMLDNGEQNKPLWLTEWGILAPSQIPPNPPKTYYTLSEAVTAQYFVDTVNWMETTTDPALGLASDGGRLFQKWFWYSLNDPLYHFGGTLVNPLTLKITTVGGIFTSYEPPAGTEPTLAPDLQPLEIAAAIPVARHGADRTLVDYRIDVRVRNSVIQNHLTDAVISLFDETNHLLGSGTVKTSRCGGDGFGAVFGVTLNPGAVYTLKVVVSPASGLDTNPANNEQFFQVTNLGTPKELFAPVIRK